ncbi:ABC transporter permease [Parafrankia sp. EUN1f]|uniref:ABC transporter permease n=1 Tax=Parafrankia sp. EUN1f TaxID=102897 RepID=UPI0001C459C2|nr:ABC transporter permease [Parafrankia sp. EUN1f]EFC86521.1 binding-protein-dependent transport systems inner membrane component [Parafrankia sp. EUN1f]
MTDLPVAGVAEATPAPPPVSEAAANSQTAPPSDTPPPSETAPVSDVAPAPGLVRPRSARKRGHGRGLTLVLRALLPLALFGLWWWGTETGRISANVLVSPPEVVRTFGDLVSEDHLFHQLWVSLSLSLRGALIGGSLGLLFGAVAGLWRIGEELLDATMQMLRTIPFLAVVPLFIVWLGIGDTPKVLLISLATLFPMYLNTYNGVRNVDRRVIEAMDVFGLRGARLVAKVIIPLALPSILTGLRFCLGVSVLALIAAEQINSSAGLGYLMYQAQSLQQVDILVVVLAIYAILGLLSDLVVRVLEKVLMPWHRGVAAR